AQSLRSRAMRRRGNASRRPARLALAPPTKAGRAPAFSRLEIPAGKPVSGPPRSRRPIPLSPPSALPDRCVALVWHGRAGHEKPAVAGGFGNRGCAGLRCAAGRRRLARCAPYPIIGFDRQALRYAAEVDPLREWLPVARRRVRSAEGVDKCV